MERRLHSDVPRGSGGAGSEYKSVGVHVLSEHFFCPRAAVLALESGADDGEEEPPLGPRLDGFADYSEHRFVEEVQTAWAELRLCFTLLAPATLLVLVVWRLCSVLPVVLTTLPLFYLAARLWDGTMRILELVHEQSIFKAAAPATVDLAPQQIHTVNWWSLRKAGFDCLKPIDPHHNFALGIKGRPWRLLTNDTTLKIPVIRKHRGERVWRPQHVLRIAAYCRLIETCEGGQAPFGVLMFAGSYECLIVPNTTVAKFQFEHAMEDVREFLRVHEEGKFEPPAPGDNRCRGCHFGKPRQYVAGQTNTILNGKPVTPLRTRAVNNRLYHCPCGDRFSWVPPHDDAVSRGIAERREPN